MTSCSITSGMPVTGVATHGVPSAIASSSTVGRPSRFPSAPTTQGAAKTAAPTDDLGHPVLRQPAEHAHPVGDPEPLGLLPQLRLLRPRSRPGRTSTSRPSASSSADRVQQVVEALLLHQPADRGDGGGPVGGTGEGEAVEVEAVVDPAYGARVGAELARSGGPG